MILTHARSLQFFLPIALIFTAGVVKPVTAADPPRPRRLTLRVVERPGGGGWNVRDTEPPVHVAEYPSQATQPEDRTSRFSEIVIHDIPAGETPRDSKAAGAEADADPVRGRPRGTLRPVRPWVQTATGQHADQPQDSGPEKVAAPVRRRRTRPWRSPSASLTLTPAAAERSGNASPAPVRISSLPDHSQTPASEIQRVRPPAKVVAVPRHQLEVLPAPVTSTPTVRVQGSAESTEPLGPQSATPPPDPAPAPPRSPDPEPAAKSTPARAPQSSPTPAPHSSPAPTPPRRSPPRPPHSTDPDLTDQETAEAKALRERFAGFDPIGSLTADNTIGGSPADLEISATDRPADYMPATAVVSMVGTSDFRVWRPSSPTMSRSTHQPLYFEDANLERYGTPCRLACRPCCQPIYSGARFAFQVAALPYQMTLQPPCRRYRYSHAFDAGRFGVRENDRLPWDRHAAAVQTAAALGLVFLIP